MKPAVLIEIQLGTVECLLQSLPEAFSEVGNAVGEEDELAMVKFLRDARKYPVVIGTVFERGAGAE